MMKSSLFWMCLLSLFSVLGPLFFYDEILAQQRPVNVAESKGVEFLSIQHARSGVLSENNATSYNLELKNVSNGTILFSDRPERIVESISTSDFISNWSAGPNSFAADPPNAVLIYEDLQTSNLDTLILELFKPSYNMALNTSEYTIMEENLTSIDLPSNFGQSILVVDTSLEERVQEVLNKLRPFN